MTGISKDRRTQHEALIAAFLEEHPQARTTGFMKALAALPSAPYVQGLCADDREWVDSVRIVPDAYVIEKRRAQSFCSKRL